jgi:hypothetical protein
MGRRRSERVGKGKGRKEKGCREKRKGKEGEGKGKCEERMKSKRKRERIFFDPICYQLCVENEQRRPIVSVIPRMKGWASLIDSVTSKNHPSLKIVTIQLLVFGLQIQTINYLSRRLRWKDTIFLKRLYCEMDMTILNPYLHQPFSLVAISQKI